MDISENLCVFSEGSFRLEFDMTVFANSLSVNFPGGKGVDCMALRGPCLFFNDGIITARELNLFYQMLNGENKSSGYLADDDIQPSWRALRTY